MDSNSIGYEVGLNADLSFGYRFPYDGYNEYFRFTPQIFFTLGGRQVIMFSLVFFQIKLMFDLDLVKY